LPLPVVTSPIRISTAFPHQIQAKSRIRPILNPQEAATLEPTPELSAIPHDPIEEGKLIRRMQLMMTLVMQTIAQDTSLTIDEAAQMIADSKKAALAMFPDKELAYEIIWRPRFQRLMRERFRIM
jgi:hypothetical protein